MVRREGEKNWTARQYHEWKRGRGKLESPTVAMVRREGRKLGYSNYIMVGREGVNIGRPDNSDGLEGGREGGKNWMTQRYHE